LFSALPVVLAGSLPVETSAKGAASPAAAGGGDGPPALPCLSSNNSDNATEPFKLSASRQRVAHCLAQTIIHLAQEFGIERLGFFTLTFADNVVHKPEASRRWNNLNRRVIKDRYARCVMVWERQVSGRLHAHCVVVLPQDIRTGFDWAAAQRGCYRSASRALRSEWAFWRATAPKYGFGRTELLPVRSTAEGVARYVGGYIRKSLGQRDLRDRGSRVVAYVGFKKSGRPWLPRFSWVTPNSGLWRLKVASFAQYVGAETMDELRSIFGPRWAYLFKDYIRSMPLDPDTSSAMLQSGRTLPKSPLPVPPPVEPKPEPFSLGDCTKAQRTRDWLRGALPSRTRPDAIRRVWLGLHPFRDESPSIPPSGLSPEGKTSAGAAFAGGSRPGAVEYVLRPDLVHPAIPPDLRRELARQSALTADFLAQDDWQLNPLPST
jgi:hypothetical protein